MGFDWREGSLGGTARIIYQTLGSIQAARRATGAGGEMGWAVSAMRWGVWGGGEGVDGLGGGEGPAGRGCGFGARCGVSTGMRWARAASGRALCWLIAGPSFENYILDFANFIF